MKLYIALVAFASLSNSAMAYDFDLPEQDASLINMKTEFDLFYKKHASYPRSWAELSFSYACGAFDISSEFMPPRRKTKSWKPKYCKFTYVINDKNRNFEIDLYDNSGKLDFIFEYDPIYRNFLHDNWILRSGR